MYQTMLLMSHVIIDLGELKVLERGSCVETVSRCGILSRGRNICRIAFVKANETKRATVS